MHLRFLELTVRSAGEELIMLFIELLPLAVSSYTYLDDFKKSLTITGHSFCYKCIERWNNSEYGGCCPCCRKRFDKSLSMFRKFETVQRGVLR